MHPGSSATARFEISRRRSVALLADIHRGAIVQNFGDELCISDALAEIECAGEVIRGFAGAALLAGEDVTQGSEAPGFDAIVFGHRIGRRRIEESRCLIRFALQD